MSKINKSYYIENEAKIMKQFESVMKSAKKIDLPVNIKDGFSLIEEKARKELKLLLSKLPFVGGKKSPYTSLMIQSALTIAFYKAIKPFNLSGREIGKLIYEIAEKDAQSIPSIKKWLYRKGIFSKKMQNYWRDWSRESLKREYPENWVAEFRESKDGIFDLGFDFIECGWLKLSQMENAEEISQYICLCDYARMKAIGIGFKRTKNLAIGADSCDFRFIRNYQTPRGWPPESLSEYSK